MVQRNLDRAHKKEHANAPDRRTPDSPIVVAVVVCRKGGVILLLLLLVLLRFYVVIRSII